MFRCITLRWRYNARISKKEGQIRVRAAVIEVSRALHESSTFRRFRSYSFLSNVGPITPFNRLMIDLLMKKIPPGNYSRMVYVWCEGI